MERPVVFWIGGWQHPEWLDAWTWLQEHAAPQAESDPSAVGRKLQDGAINPRLVVLAVRRPGQWSRADVELWTSLAPLARWVALLGSWCEGEPRTGKPWPGVTRVYWHQARARLPGELAAAMGAGGMAALPRTAAEVDRCLARLPPGACRPPRAMAIATSARATFEYLADAASALGYAAWWCAKDEPVAARGIHAGLWEGDLRRPGAAESLAEFVQRLRPAPVLVLLDFVRAPEAELVRRCGAAGLLSKPFQLADWEAILGER